MTELLQRVAHIGLAVRDLDAAVRLYETGFGVTPGPRRHSDSEQMDAVMFAVGDLHFELMQATDPESPVARFIERRGEGVHHIAYEVADVSAALEHARRAGLETVDAEPRTGLDGTRVAFIHPRSVGGVLTELVESR